jgi:uncharacterized protein YkwD
MYKLAKILSVFIVVISTIVLSGTIFLAGYKSGYDIGTYTEKIANQKSLENIVSSTTKPIATDVPAETKIVYITPHPAAKVTWGGPQLWEAVNKRRVELGVGPMQVKEEVCTIASIRLNQLLSLGTLDGHKGFTNMPADRPDLKWIFDKYNLSEFLVGGASSPQNAVDLWENTLGHKELMSGGQYVWGCIYAQSGMAVAIAAY